jgi:hypothetical protein
MSGYLPISLVQRNDGGFRQPSVASRCGLWAVGAALLRQML